MDFEQIAKEYCRAVRGTRSQVAWSAARVPQQCGVFVGKGQAMADGCGGISSRGTERDRPRSRAEAFFRAGMPSLDRHAEPLTLPRLRPT